ncbi:MAG: Crp/Fnr family transcriptional regulator [Burkholderiaceae bacterium]|jgi:CRP-like cAMP-binding protein|nr:Crp/Fnr family transcriptional regulator [Burkholderiaceae bacterium]
MLSPTVFDWPGDTVVLPVGATLMRRGEPLKHVYHLDAGRVALGLRAQGSFVHRMGVIDAPCWLNATCAVLNQTPLVDAVADTKVELRQVPLAAFQTTLDGFSGAAHSVLYDMAQGYRQQLELSISRLAKDAEARCAEWLLRHAEPVQNSPNASAVVMLKQRKRLIAEQLGIAPETFSRVLRQLRERSLISGTGRVLNLVNLNGLRILAGT